MKTLISVFLTILFLFSIASQAGVIIKMTQLSESMELDMKSTMYIDKDRLRMEASGSGQNQVIIFRGDKNLFWTIDDENKTYFEMTQEDIKKLKVQMDKMQKIMMEQMKNMPEEQRKMMEKMMPSNIPSKETVKTTYTKKSSHMPFGLTIPGTTLV